MTSSNTSRNDENSTPRRAGVLKRGHDHLTTSTPRTPLSPSPAANKSVTLSKAALQKSAQSSPACTTGAMSSPGTPGLTTPSKGCEENNIKVYIRTRPLSPEIGSCCVLDTESSKVSVIDPKGRKAGKAPAGCGAEEFKFEDGVLPPDISQEEFFETVGLPAATSVLDGFNVTIFAYGQTGSGKTHSVYGSGGRSADASAPADMGLAGRVVQYLIRASKGLAAATEGVRWRYSLSLLDVYDEKVTDLFDLCEKQVREGGRKGRERVYVEGAVWKAIGSAAQAYDYLVEGLRGRHVAYTKLNSHSSRSHTICMLKVERDQEEDEGVKNCTAVMTIVDLCGSERVKKSDVEGARLKEAININQSLSALKTVIEALANNAAYVNYRSSKLTWLLRECIGGNAKVSLIAHVNPDPSHLDESKSTLRFVTVVKTVKTKSRRVERIKTAEEIEADERAREAEEEAMRLAGFEEEEVPELPATQEWGGGTELALADAETQVSPGRFGGGVEALVQVLSRLAELQASGSLSEQEYKAARGKAIAEWVPPPKEGELPASQLLQLWREEEEEEAAAEEEAEAAKESDGPERKRSRKSLEVLRTQGITLRFQGPGPNDQQKLLVRMTATFGAARSAFLAVHPELSAGATSFWLREQLVPEDVTMADLELREGDAVVVRVRT